MTLNSYSPKSRRVRLCCIYPNLSGFFRYSLREEEEKLLRAAALALRKVKKQLLATARHVVADGR